MAIKDADRWLSACKGDAMRADVIQGELLNLHARAKCAQDNTMHQKKTNVCMNVRASCALHNMGQAKPCIHM